MQKFLETTEAELNERENVAAPRNIEEELQWLEVHAVESA